MHTIGRNGESKLKQHLPTPPSRDNGIIKPEVVIVVSKLTEFLKGYVYDSDFILD